MSQSSQPPSHSASPGTPLEPGQVLAGKYRIDRVLGAGGMGVVVAATHLELEQRVAVKFLQATALDNTEAAARFVREARAAVKIHSEHVARVIDVSRLENGAPYIVMEYLEGQDLAALLGAGRLTSEDAVDYILQACDAMAEAHAAGIVHRDLKPSNLFLTRRSDGAPVIKVLDFGISKVSTPNTADAHLTKTATIIGSPFYMSPEQLKSAREVDHRTDVWSLGVILFELLTGRPPFYAETLPELVAAIMVSEPPALRELRPDVPAELEAVIARCLQKNRDARFRNVGELAAALGPFAPRRSRFTLERVLKLSGTEHAPVSVPPAQPSAHHAPELAAAATATGATWSETRPVDLQRAKSPLLWLIAAMVALGAVGGLVFALRDAPADPEPATSSAAPATSAEPAPAAAPPSQESPAPATATEPGPLIAPAQSATATAPAPSTAAPARDAKRPAPAARPKPAVAARTAAPVVAAPAPATAAPTATATATAKRRTLDIDLK